MIESTLIKATNANVFVDKYDEDGVWLSVQTMQGGAHCVIAPEQVKEMIAALQAVLDDIK